MHLLPRNQAALQAHHPELLARVQAASNLRSGSRSLDRATTLARPEVARARFLVCFGVGTGAELEAVVGLRPERATWVVEPEIEVFAAMLASRDMSAVLQNPAVEWWVGLSPDDLKTSLLAATMMPRFLYCSSAFAMVRPPSADLEHRARVEEAVSTFELAAQRAVDIVGNDVEDALLGLRNSLANRDATFASRGVSALEGLLAGHAAVVASSGPSLEAALGELAALPEHVALFCPDTSQTILQRAGIQPHVVACRERTEMTIRHFEGLAPTEAVLVAPPVLQPRILQLHPGPRLNVLRQSDLSTWLGVPDAGMEFEGSSGNLAFNLAVLAGCDPIILVGQDLSFGDDGRTHAQGAATGSRQSYYDEEAAIEVPGNRSPRVRTTPTWLRFLRVFEADVARAPGRVLNATAGGARIEGAEVVELSEALARIEPRPPVAALLRNAAEPRSSAQQAELRRQLDLRIASTRELLLDIYEVSQVGLGFAEKQRAYFVPPQGQAPDLGLLYGQDPYRTLEGLRARIVRPELPAFADLFAPIFQPSFIDMERKRFRLELDADDAAGLGFALLELYEQWFRSAFVLSARLLALLGAEAGGERSAESEAADRAQARKPT